MTTVTHQSSFQVPEGSLGLVDGTFQALWFCSLIKLFGYLRKKNMILAEGDKWKEWYFPLPQELCVKSQVKGIVGSALKELRSSLRHLYRRMGVLGVMLVRREYFLPRDDGNEVL